MTIDIDKLTESEREGLDKAREIASQFEDAIFTTFLAADTRGPDRRGLRERSKETWRDLADSLVEFAIEHDRDD